ncbi:MAG: 4Fe-4S binding protein [Candidatus Aminicenantes bacterium]|nr:4Fe-4S binding protein [Candidatus Aminicenantes bacterium]
MNRKAASVLALVLGLGSILIALFRLGVGPLPAKIVVLFGLLGASALAFHFRQAWLRFPILIASVGYLGFFEGSCLCPNGALQNIALNAGLSQLAKTGLYVLEIGVIFTVILLFGNLYCGWVCHKGGIQEFLYRRSFRIRIPARVDRALRGLRFVVLGFALAYPVLKGEKLFVKIDPFKALFNLDGNVPLLAFLGVTLLASVFIHRPFCRYVCPFGAVAGAVNALSLFRLNADGRCTSCAVCAKACPAGAIRVDRGAGRMIVDKTVCLSCLECARACPKGCLDGSDALRPGASLPCPDAESLAPLPAAYPAGSGSLKSPV